MIKFEIKYFFLLLILIVPFAAASTHTIYNAWHDGNGSFTANGLNFSLTASSAQTEIAIKYNYGTILVSNKTCDETSKFVFCLDSTRTAGFDYTWRFYRLQYKIRIEAKIAAVTISRQASKTDLLVGQESQLTAVIRNTGSVTASNLNFADAFPGFAIASVTNCQIKDASIVWSGNLTPGQSFACSYTIMAINKTSLRSAATVSYFNGALAASNSSATLNFNVKRDEIMVKTPAISNPELGQANHLYVSMNNTLTDPVHIKSLLITVPYGLRVTFTRGLEKVNEYRYEYSGTLDSKSAFTVNLTAIAEMAKNYFIPVVVEYEVGTNAKSISRNISFNVSLQNLSINFDTGLSRKIIVSVSNPGTQQFSGVELKVSSRCANISIARHINQLGPQGVIDIEIPVMANGSCEFIASMQYETKYGQQLSLTRSVVYSSLPKVVPQQANASAAPKATEQGQQVQTTEETQKENLMASLKDRRLIAIAAFVLVVFTFIAWLWKRKKRLVSRKEAKEVEAELAKPPEAVPPEVKIAARKDVKEKSVKPTPKAEKEQATAVEPVEEAQSSEEHEEIASKHAKKPKASRKKSAKESSFRF